MTRQAGSLDAGGLAAIPFVPLWTQPTAVEELSRLRAAIGGGPRLLIKRDDTLPFGGGNKVRKLSLVAARALAHGADTLITCGGIQSNHARATAAIAARLGLRCVLVHNGARPRRATGNALLDELFGAERHFVATGKDRAPAMVAIEARLRAEGRWPFIIPLGASTPLGAAAFARAVGELVSQGVRPDIIVHALSSGGTQAGLVAGCALHGLAARIVGISADEPEDVLAAEVRQLIDGLYGEFAPGAARPNAGDVVVDAGHVGRGYGIPTEGSEEALRLFARTDAILLDPTYTAKAAAALIAYVRDGRFTADQTILFWHTGGVPGLFA